MSDEEGNICGAELTTKDGVCERTASFPDNRCGYHTSEGDKDRDWKPNYKHGLYQDRGEYYKTQTPEDQEWLDAVSDDLINKSQFDKEDLSAFEKCRQIAVDLHQRRKADGYISHQGLTEDKTVGFHEDHGEIKKTEENTLMVTKDRLSRESRMTMKDLGILDQEEAEEDDESLLEQLSKDA